MSALLAIETSSERGSLALGKSDGTLLLNREWQSAPHSSMLPQIISEQRSMLGDLAVVLVGTGPGSYSGVRVGIIAAQALAVALAQHPMIVGVESHRAMIPRLCAELAAGSVNSERAKSRGAIVTDARRQSAAVTLFSCEKNFVLEDARPELMDWDRVRLLSEECVLFFTEKVQGFDEDNIRHHHAEDLIKAYLQSGGQAGWFTFPPQAVYLHAAEYAKVAEVAEAADLRREAS